MSFVDSDGNIIVPKTVRPLIEYEPTMMGEKMGSLKQYRHGKLHIREYDTYYTVHYDKIDPRNDPFGHIIMDASKYFPGVIMLSLFSNYLIDKEKWHEMNFDISPLILLFFQRYSIALQINSKRVKNAVVRR